MRFKKSEWLMFAVFGATVALVLVWTALPKKDSEEFIDTKSIQIAK